MRICGAQGYPSQNRFRVRFPAPSIKLNNNLESLFRLAIFSDFWRCEPENLALLLHEELKSQANKNQTDSAAGIESGRQDFVLKLDPKAPFDSNHDRRLEIFLAGPEWSAIFYTVLGCTGGEPFVAGDDINEWTERHRREFQRAIPHYPMLGRIWDTYINVSYQAEEITGLKNECLKVKASTSNAMALQGLDKLIYTCDEALKSGLGLYLAAD